METSQGALDDVVERLRRHGTDLTQVEVKSAAGGAPRSLWESVSAFSNTSGGLVILGLDESSGFIPPHGFNAAAIRDAVISGLSGPKPSVSPSPLAYVDLDLVDDAPVVVIEIDELPAHDKPCFVVAQGKEHGSYERRADGDHRMSTYQVFLHSINVKQPDDDTRPVEGAGLRDLDADLVERTLRRLRRAGRRVVADVESDRDALRRLNVLCRNRTDDVPTVAGLLALGRYPQEFFPQWMISVAVFPGLTKDAVDEDIRMLDHQTVDGPIPDMIDRTVDAVLRNLRSELHSRGAGAESVPEIPEDVIREAVVNAVTHRDYSDFVRGEQVLVEVFPDRVEVSNAGGIWGGRNERELMDGVSRSRNEKLALLLQDVPFADRNEVVCENKGSGIPRMTGLMRTRGLAIPRFRDRTTTFTVTLDRYGLLDPVTRRRLTELGADRLTAHEQCALAMVNRREFVDDQVLRHQLGIDSRDAQVLLAGLVRDRWLKNPDRRGGPYGPGRRLTPPDRQATLPGLPARADDVGADRSHADGRILDALSRDVEKTVHQIAESTGMSVSYLRLRLRVLVDQGQVHATAPPTSTKRAYLLVTRPGT